MNGKALTLLAAGVATYVLWPKKAKAAEPQPAVAPIDTTPKVEPAPPLPPAAPSPGNPSTAAFWAQPPPPGRETVGPTEPIASGTSYTLKAGESWSNVAERTYGNFRWWPFLWDANRDKYPNPDRLSAGPNTITIPAKSTLPFTKQSAYFARADEHKRIWAAHKRSPNWGKTLPKMPASVLDATK